MNTHAGNVSGSFAQLKRGSPFYRLFDGGRVPLKNIRPKMAESIGDGVPEAFMLDMEKFTARQYYAAIHWVRHRCDPSSTLDRRREN
jgi:hypothetical protein